MTVTFVTLPERLTVRRTSAASFVPTPTTARYPRPARATEPSARRKAVSEAPTPARSGALRSPVPASVNPLTLPRAKRSDSVG